MSANNYVRPVNGVLQAEPIQGTDIHSGAATSGQVLTADGSGGAAFQNNAASVTYRAGTVSVGSGATSATITFSSTIGTTSYAITPTWINTTDASVQYQPFTVTAQSATAVTVKWNSPTGTANYSIMYVAIVNN